MKLQVLCGMIASGKSTYARAAARAGVIIVNDDAIVNMVHADNYNLYDDSLKVLYKSVENHIVGTGLAMGRSILVDRGLNVSLEGRRRWLALASSFDVVCEAVVLPRESPEIHAARRTASDGRGHSFDYWLRVATLHDSLYCDPSESEGFGAVRRVSFAEVSSGLVCS